MAALGTPLHRHVGLQDQDVTVGIRPEHLQLTASQADNEGWPFRVTHKENMGADFFLHGTVNGSNHRMVARARPEDVAGIAIGHDVYLRAQAGKAMVFGGDDRRVYFGEGA